MLSDYEDSGVGSKAGVASETEAGVAVSSEEEEEDEEEEEEEVGS